MGTTARKVSIAPVAGGRSRVRVVETPTSARPTTEETIEVSAVVPLFNEEDNVAEFFERLRATLSGLGRSWEVIFIDDGSSDGTSQQTEKLASQHSEVRTIRLRRNFGQTAALAAGFDHARGKIVVTLDGDLQNPPEEIPRLLRKIEEGYDLVSGWRVNRQDPFLRRVFPSRIANQLIGWITGTRLHDYGCSLKAYRWEILDEIKIHGDMHRFLPAFAGALGARIAEIPVRHAPRERGNSKYGLLRTLIVMVDMIGIRFLLPYSFKPLKIFGMMGLGSLALGGVINLYLSYVRLFLGQGLANRPLLLLGLLLIIMGVQLVVLGILAELQVRGMLSNGARTYAIAARRGFGGNTEPGADGRERDDLAFRRPRRK